MDKFKIFNKIKIDTDKYEEIEINKEELKSKMIGKVNSSKRSMRKRKIKSRLIGTVAIISVIMVGIGVTNPSLANHLKEKLPQFETMLDKIKLYMDFKEEKYDLTKNSEYEEQKQEHKKSKLSATPINVSSKGDGLNITINNAMYDKKKLYLNMTLKTDKSFNKSKYKDLVGDSVYGDGSKVMYITDLKIYINNMKLYNYSCGPGIVDIVDENTINLSYLIELSHKNNVKDANFKISFGVTNYKNNNPNFDHIVGEKYLFDFNIKAVDDNYKSIVVDKKDGDYTLKKVNITDTYVEVQIELPFQTSLGNPHNNFIIVHDDKGRELNMSNGIDGKNKIYTQINELAEIGQMPKYIDIFVCTNYAQEENALSTFRVNID